MKQETVTQVSAVALCDPMAGNTIGYIPDSE